MNIKFRLILMNFMQFFIWGAWLLTIGAYWFQNKHWSGTQFGAIFSTMGISAIFMPALTGIIADRFINAEKLYGILHILGALVLFSLPMVTRSYYIFLGNVVEHVILHANVIIIDHSCLFSFKKQTIRML